MKLSVRVPKMIWQTSLLAFKQFTLPNLGFGMDAFSAAAGSVGLASCSP